jgi:hypothetical protein
VREAKNLYTGVAPSKTGVILAATDEVDYFQAVAFGELSLGPLAAGDDVAVQFDGYSIRFHAERFHQRRQRKFSAAWVGGEDAFFSIDVQLHWS